jgi:thiol-disulfide isomerase/thioredoxin
MKIFRTVWFATLLVACSGLSVADEMPFDQAHYEAMHNNGKPFAVAFHANWCPTCRAQAPVLKELTQTREFSSITLFVANFDTEKVLERSLGVTKQSTIVVFKDGKESARSTGDTQRESLAELWRHAVP